MIFKSITGAACAFVTVVSFNANAALINNGGGLIYDDVLDITWAQPDALRTWDAANTWAAGLTLGGVSGWRLPYISLAAGAGPFTGTPVDCSTASEVACRDNELGYMFYQNLGGTFGTSILESGDPDLALFPTLEPRFYWSATEESTLFAWSFTFADYGFAQAGSSGYNTKTNGSQIGSWAVHSGNIVPVPAAVWLFGSGLLCLIGVARRKKA